MKNILIIIFLFITNLTFGQQVTAPDVKTFLPSTLNQDGSGFVLNGFTSTTTLLASISLINPPSGTTFNLTTTTGLVAASGFTLSGNKTRLVVTGTMSNINNALSSLKVNTGATKGNVQISVASTINPTGYYYNGVNGHFYKPVTTGASYTSARAASLLTTFKGQNGYLLTLTSADEDNFIQSNVPQTNIWFAATDEVTDGRWVIDAGPEKGTVMKTVNGQLYGNIPGVYNNWAGGEPNGSNHSEDYAVTKWNGNQWNDLSNNWNNPYVIEYGTWSNPDDQTFTEFYSNSVVHSNGDVLRVAFNLNFNGGIDETKFNARMNTKINNVWTQSQSAAKPLNGLGKVDMTSDFDTTRVSNSTNKMSTTAGQTEWGVLYVNYNGGSRLLVDMRKFGSTSPSSISNIQLFDLYNGPVTFISNDVTWAQYFIPEDINSKILTSTFSSNIRNGGSFYGLQIEPTFSVATSYKEQGIVLQYIESANALLDQIVTVSDVYSAFKELSNGGIFGNQSGNEFTSGIQFMNADVNSDNQFDEEDAFRLLQHLTGQRSLLEANQLVYMIKLFNKSTYDLISKTNWKSQNNSTTILYPFTIGATLLNSYDVSVAWKGDVNLSHSTAPILSSTTPTNQSMGLRTMSTATNDVEAEIMTEIIEGKIIATIKVNPNTHELVGTQFKVNYDKTILKFEKVEFITKYNPTNYGANKGDYINVGSLITGDGILDNTTEYKITFTPLSIIESILGLISFSSTDAVGKNGSQIKVKLL